MAEREEVPRKPQQRIAAVSSDEPKNELINPTKNFLKFGEELQQVLPIFCNHSEQYVITRILTLQQRQDNIRRAKGLPATGWTRPVHVDPAKPESRTAERDYWLWPEAWEDTARRVAIDRMVEIGALECATREQALNGWVDGKGNKRPPVLTAAEAGQGKVFAYRPAWENWPALIEEGRRQLREKRKRIAEMKAALRKAEEEAGTEDADEPPVPALRSRPVVVPITPRRLFTPGKPTIIDLSEEAQLEVPFEKVRVKVSQPATFGLVLRNNVLDCDVQVEENPHYTADSRNATSNGNGKNPQNTADSDLGRFEMRLASVAKVTLPKVKLREAYAHIEKAVRGGIDRTAIEEFACAEVLKKAVNFARLQKPFSAGGLVPNMVKEAVPQFLTWQAARTPANGNGKHAEPSTGDAIDAYLRERGLDGGGS